MTYYYIAFQESDYQGNVIGYGYGPQPTSGMNPIGSEAIFSEFEPWQGRLAELGYEVSRPE